MYMLGLHPRELGWDYGVPVHGHNMIPICQQHWTHMEAIRHTSWSNILPIWKTYCTTMEAILHNNGDNTYGANMCHYVYNIVSKLAHCWFSVCTILPPHVSNMLAILVSYCEHAQTPNNPTISPLDAAIVMCILGCIKRGLWLAPPHVMYMLGLHPRELWWDYGVLVHGHSMKPVCKQHWTPVEAIMHT